MVKPGWQLLFIKPCSPVASVGCGELNKPHQSRTMRFLRHRILHALAVISPCGRDAIPSPGMAIGRTTPGTVAEGFNQKNGLVTLTTLAHKNNINIR